VADRTVTIDLLARDRASKVFKNVDAAAHRSEKGIGGLGKTMEHVGKIAAAGLAAGVVAAGLSLRKFVDDGREANKINALTAAVLKSTGGAARVSAKDVQELAKRISEKTGIDDTAIKSNENLLLTFTNIRDGLGKNNKIFDQATLAVQNMSVALKEDTKNASIQLGKALNDPIKGITALSRVGVSFTAQQKAQIKVLVDSGHTMAAQKVILHELGKEFGGAAAAAATPWDKVKAKLHNISEELGQKLIPKLDQLATWIDTKGLPALENFGKWFEEKVMPKVRALRDYLVKTLFPALKRMSDDLIPALSGSMRTWMDNIDGVRDAWRRLTGETKGAGKETNLTTKLIGAVLKQFVKSATSVLSPFVKLVEALVLALNGVKNSIEWLGSKGAAALSNIKGAISGIVFPKLPGWATGGLPNPFKGHKAAGGPVSAGSAYMVGERGPEMFVPHTSGHIVPHGTGSAFDIGEFLTSSMAAGIKHGGKKAVAAMKDLVDQIKGKLGDLRQQAKDIASSAADSVRGVLDVSQIGQAIETTVAGTTTPGRSIIDPLTGAVTAGPDVTTPDVTTISTPSASSVLTGFAGQATAFAAALAAMARKHLAPALIAAVAAAGPASGLVAAQAFASESAAAVNVDNAAMAAINKAGVGAGATVLSTTPLPAQINREEATLASLQRIEKLLTSSGNVAEVKLKGNDIWVVVTREEKASQRRK
jgi:hypothetical protein